MIEIIQTIAFMSALYFSIAYFTTIVEAIMKRGNTLGIAGYLAVISWGIFYYLIIKY